MDKESWINRFSKEPAHPFVSLSGNINSNISLNIFLESQPPLYNLNRTARNIDPALKKMRLPQGKLFIADPVEKEIFLLKQLDNLHKTVKRTRLEPTVRILALYSGFCTLWERSNTSDLAQMELQEKDTLIKLVKAGCNVRVIVNLDIYKAISCGFMMGEITTRVSDLCAVCDELSDYSNFEIAIESDMIGYEPILILDNVLLNFTSNFEDRRNYSFSHWTSDSKSIERTAYEFDLKFNKCRTDTIRFMQMNNRQKISEIIFLYLQQKLSELDGGR